MPNVSSIPIYLALPNKYFASLFFLYLGEETFFLLTGAGPSLLLFFPRAYAWDKEMFFIGERTTCACMMMWLWERNVAGGERDMHGLRPVHVLPLLICCDYSPLTAKPRTQHESLKNWAHQIRGCLGTRVLWHLFDRLYFFVASHYRLYFFVAVIWCACIYIVLIHNGL